MINLRTIFDSSELLSPPTLEAIVQAEQKFGCSFPDQLRSLYLQSNGIHGNWTVTIFEVEAVFERNETYETFEYLPDHMYIGNDNGNTGIFISKSSEELRVFASDLGDQDANSLVVLASSISVWFGCGCPWSDGHLGAPGSIKKTDLRRR
jgi:hypothetical protein